MKGGMLGRLETTDVEVFPVMTIWVTTVTILLWVAGAAPRTEIWGLVGG